MGIPLRPAAAALALCWVAACSTGPGEKTSPGTDGGGGDAGEPRGDAAPGTRPGPAGGPRAGGPTSGFGVTLLTDRSRYTVGDEIRMELRVVNRTDRPVDLEFSDGQRYDFVLTDGDGEELWRWSDGRGFIQALGTETLGPDGDTLVYRERGPDLPADARRLTGTVTSSSHPLSATVPVAVEP